MPAVVALLRGVNVGGKGKLAMTDLRLAAAAAGMVDPQTYIQSGNVVGTTSVRSTEQLARALESAIAELGGVAPDVTVRTRAELDRVVDSDPFVVRGEDTAFVHVLFGIEPGPAPTDLSALKAFLPEEVAAVQRDLHLFLPNGMGRAKLPAAIARQSGFNGTARSWRTVTTLLDMASAVG